MVYVKLYGVLYNDLVGDDELLCVVFDVCVVYCKGLLLMVLVLVDNGCELELVDEVDVLLLFEVFVDCVYLLDGWLVLWWFGGVVYYDL